MITTQRILTSYLSVRATSSQCYRRIRVAGGKESSTDVLESSPPWIGSRSLAVLLPLQVPQQQLRVGSAVCCTTTQQTTNTSCPSKSETFSRSRVMKKDGTADLMQADSLVVTLPTTSSTSKSTMNIVSPLRHAVMELSLYVHKCEVLCELKTWQQVHEADHHKIQLFERM